MVERGVFDVHIGGHAREDTLGAPAVGGRRIAVFGSVVRGDDTPESDVDIRVTLKPSGERPALGLKWIGLEQEWSRVLERDVDLVSGEE
jgi:predicted nucleotidyltransferase